MMGGATYRAIGRVEQSIGNILFRVPADAPVTERALVRVQGADGRLAVSAPFTIAPQPKGVKVTGAGCGLAGWKVEWERCEGATQGYAVLVGDPSTSQFTQIGQTDGVDKTEFTVPAEKLQGVERPVFSVASRAGNGYGKRAVGVLNTPSNPLVIKSASLPFSETFLRYPSIYFSPKAGANAEVLYRNQSVGDVPPGSSFVGLRCNRDLPTFDTSSYFSPTNADNMASLTLCELDLTGVATADKLVLHISGMLVSADDSDLSTARMRVLLDGAPLADLQGALEQQATGKTQEWYFGLNGGEKHQLAVEFAGKGEDDLLAIRRIAIRRAVQQPSVALRIVKAPANRPNMGMGTFTLELENKSVQPLANLLVKGYCRGKWVAQHTVEKLEGMGKAEFKMALDLSTSENLGVLIATAFDCVVDPNNPTVNGHVAHEVNSQGKVVAMPTSRTVSSGLGPQIVDPKLRYTVREKLIFTDNGGYYGKHTDDQSATLKFLPADPNMKVREKFLRFALEPDEAALQVFTAFVPNDLTVSYTRDRAYLMGDKLEMPMTFISEAPDGGVTLFFEALEGSSADGWVAEVDMVPPANQLSLTKVSMHGRGIGAEGTVPVTLTVRNSWGTRQPNATAMVRTAKGFYYREPVSVGLGETTIILNGKIDLPAATPTLMEVSIAGDDTNEIDNVLYGYAVYDRYCAPDSMPRRPVQMRAIMVNAHDNYLAEDIALPSISQTNALGIPAASAQLNTKQVVLTYTLSEGARLLCAGMELTSGVTPIDLSHPVLLQVEAADGQKKSYSLQLELAQTIEWSLAPQQTLVYGDAPVPVQASATSKLPLTFVSFQSRVATVAGGTLRIGKPGKATITALQPGGGVYAPAPSVAHEVTVGKRPITVKATVAQATYGVPLDWDFTYTQLVDDEDLRSMPDPLGKGVFKILNSNGVEMKSSTLLPVGRYTIAPQVDNAYETELYTVTPEGAEFDVVQGAYWPVSFRVQGADGQPLENATVMLGQQARTTDSQGEVLYAVQQGASYSFTVGSDGYTPVVEYVNMVSGMAMQRTVTLQKATIALHYTAGEHGRLAGNANQLVGSGASGQEVMTIPEIGYRFTGWSDGGTENPRIDRNVTRLLEVEALFAQLTYTIAYSIGEGGVLESGESTRQQTVGYGNDGQEVKVKEADADHYLMCWDDGVATPARQERDVKQDQAVTALFGRYMPLEPAQFNGFDNGAIGESWYTLAGGESGVA